MTHDRYAEFDQAVAERLQPHQRSLVHPSNSWKEGGRWTLRTIDGVVLHEDPAPAPPPPRYAAPVRRAAAPAPVQRAAAPAEDARVGNLVARVGALEAETQAQRALLADFQRSVRALLVKIQKMETTDE